MANWLARESAELDLALHVRMGVKEKSKSVMEFCFQIFVGTLHRKMSLDRQTEHNLFSSEAGIF